MSLKVLISKGRHVVAVSGGVDSVVLLDLLTKIPDHDLIVAHFDHGIRPNSKEDRILVQNLAKKYGLAFFYEEGKLGANASEEQARLARYNFLRSVMHENNAKSVITAHHQDDLIETSLINMMRGTGRRGLTSLRSHDNLQRPLLDIPKDQIIKYAESNGLVWNEDQTNTDTKYLRNYIRINILPKFSKSDRDKLLKIISKTKEFNRQLDTELSRLLDDHISSGELDRYWFIMLPHAVAKETMASWLRNEGIASFDRSTLERLVHASKTFRANTKVDIYNDYALVVKKRHLALTTIDR